MKLKLRTKLLIFTQLTITLIFGTFILYNGLKQEKTAKTNAIELVKSYGEQYALLCKNYLDKDMSFTKALANSLEQIKTFTPEQRDTIYGRMMLEMLENNKKYISVWNTIELRFIDTSYHQLFGRKSLVTLRKDTGNEITELFKDMSGDNPESAYYRMKTLSTPAIMEPYTDPDVGDFLITSVTTPVIIENEFAGLGGVDIPLTVFQTFIDSMKNMVAGEEAMVISNTGIIIAHTNKTLVGEQIINSEDGEGTNAKTLQTIQSGQNVYNEFEQNEASFFTTMTPFYIDGTDTPWIFGITIPLDTIMNDARKANRRTLWLGILGIAMFFTVIWFIASYIVNPLTATNKSFQELAKGNISDKQKLKINTGDELEELGNSVNNLINGLKATVSFAQEIEKGNFDVDYQALGENDKLGTALIKMRNGLAELKNKDLKRQEIDHQQNWTSTGLAKFSEILRKPTNSIADLMQELVTELISYSDANQGGIFIINNEQKDDLYIEPVASIAYNQEKLDQKRIEIGEGLIGTCIRENKKIYLTEIPDNYISLSSGLGEHVPACVLIIPLNNNAETLGAMEFSSLKVLKDFQIEFFESLAISVASAISTIKLNIQTNRLLETTQEQAEAMQAQEEELRQNMEEMMATQEESGRRIEELEQALSKQKMK